MKRIRLFSIGLAILLLALPVHADMSSTNYRITTSVISGGGTPMASANFQLNSTPGQPSPLMEQGMDPFSDNYGLLPGFWYTLNRLMDTDSDGLSDALEESTCTNPLDADTDDDGIPDGAEDVNQNGMVDAGETDPCNSDTDEDGLQDGTEKGLTEGDPDTGDGFITDADPASTTDPLDNDTDNDGLLDGDEDTNHDGQVDSGETDPNVSNRKKAMPWIPLLLLDD